MKLKSMLLAWVVAAGALAFAAGGRAADAAETMKASPAWDLAKDAGEVSTAFARDGFVPLDAAHAFDIPHTAVKDSQCFTVRIDFSCADDTQKRSMQLLTQKTPTTGWSLAYTLWGGMGSPIMLGANDANLNAGWFRTKPGQKHTMIVTARNGLIVVYWNGQILKRFFTRIIPNLEPVRVGPAQPDDGKGPVRHMEGVKLLGLAFWNEGYFAPGESKAFAEGFRGGPGWLMSCPTEDPKVKLPRILCYGDSILGGYGPRLRKALEGKAYVYAWRGFIGGADGAKLWKKPFEDACAVVPFDAVVFNNGLHSLHWSEDKVSDALLTETQRTIYRCFRDGAPTAKIWWLATTPHTSRQKNAEGKVDAMGELNPIVLRINRLTAAAMAEEKVPVIDAYTLLAGRLDLACGDGYHWSGAAYDLMVEKIIDTVMPALAP